MNADLNQIAVSSNFEALVVMGLFLTFFFIVALFLRKPKKPSSSPELTRERIRDLILGKAKGTVRSTRSGFAADENEIRYTMMKHQYLFGKMFESASLTPENRLKMRNGDTIAPHSREHGLAAGQSADKLRAFVIKEYGIDLETMEDLEKPSSKS